MKAHLLNGELLKLDKYSIGVGDRFAREAAAQLQACILVQQHGTPVVPVWNKSNREHVIIGSEPSSTRAAADAAVKAFHWGLPYHIDADHIRLETVDRFVPHADFYTIDVADWLSQPAPAVDVKRFVDGHPELVGRIPVPGIEKELLNSPEDVERMAGKYLRAVQEAGKVYQHIHQARGSRQFITEISMDETDLPQTPAELLLILAALADLEIPVQTVAPKFAGRFNKGVDYVGDLVKFEKEFNDDLAVLAFAVQQYGLPPSLKLSVHSGSDKFSLYGPIRRALKRFGAGLHLKTAGTTWLEELIGLAEAGGSGLALAKNIYAEAWAHADELCAPYAAVIDIDRARLPSPQVVNEWSSQQFAAALRHDKRNPQYNAHLRQLLHVAYKIAAQKGERYLEALETHRTTVAKNVTENLYERHLKPLFLNGD